jgi:hypothetical protein
MMDEAEEEHHVVDVLSREIMGLKPDDPEYAAKFTVLYENVEHHIEEEESEMLPVADELGPERMEELGTKMEQMKQNLMKTGNGRTQSRASSTRSGTRSKSARRTKTGAAARSRSGSASGSGKSRSRK